jgi:hypothetical protein
VAGFAEWPDSFDFWAAPVAYRGEDFRDDHLCAIARRIPSRHAVMTRRDERADDEALTPEQMAALKTFDRAVDAASDPEVLSLVVPAVLGSRCGGGPRLPGCSRRQLRVLLNLKKAHERALARDAHAVRVCLGTDDRDSDET